MAVVIIPVPISNSPASAAGYLLGFALCALVSGLWLAVKGVRNEGGLRPTGWVVVVGLSLVGALGVAASVWLIGQVV